MHELLALIHSHLAAHGCASKGLTGSFSSLEKMLIYHTNHVRYSTSCLWGAPDVDDRSGCRYNELVLDGTKYVAALPSVIEAVFLPVRGPVHHREGDEGSAREMHSRFIHAYRGVDVPLLAFDVVEARAGRAPFRLAT